MELRLIDSVRGEVQSDFKHLVELESLDRLNGNINWLVHDGWELSTLRRIERSDESACWHALLKRDRPIFPARAASSVTEHSPHPMGQERVALLAAE